MSPKAIGILSVAGMCVFVGAYYLVGHMLILYLLFATAVLLGPILFLVGLHKLYARLSKRLRCKEETQGYVVDYILSPWKYANPHRRPHRSRNYYYRWFPVVEYEVDGQRLRQKNKIREPLKKAHIKRHEGKGRRSRPEFSQFLRPNAGFCPVFLRLSHKKGAKAPVMLPAVFARPSPGSRGLRRQT